MNVGVSVKNLIIGVFVKMIISGILERVFMNVTAFKIDEYFNIKNGSFENV